MSSVIAYHIYSYTCQLITYILCTHINLSHISYACTHFYTQLSSSPFSHTPNEGSDRTSMQKIINKLLSKNCLKYAFVLLYTLCQTPAGCLPLCICSDPFCRKLSKPFQRQFSLVHHRNTFSDREPPCITLSTSTRVHWQNQ